MQISRKNIIIACTFGLVNLIVVIVVLTVANNEMAHRTAHQRRKYSNDATGFVGSDRRNHNQHMSRYRQGWLLRI